MSGFHVDPVGMDGLYNVFHRAASDVDETLRYAVRHCELTFEQEGLLAYLDDSHHKAYQRMTETLEQVRRLTQSAATQVNLAQKSYAASDVSAAARLDRSYPGAQDPADLRGTLSPGRPDLWPEHPRALFADVAEPTKHLVPPSYANAVEMWSLNPMTDLVSPASWLRQVSVSLFDHDPFQRWTEQLSGDWQSYTYCGAAWRIIGNAMQDVGRNLTAAAADVSTVWQGNAAEAEQEFQLRLGAAAMAVHHACDQYGDLYDQAAEATKNLFSVVSGMITRLIDLLLIINLAGAVGTVTIETGIGAVAGYGVAAYYAWQAYNLYNEIAKFYGTAEAVVKGIAATIAMIELGGAGDELPALKPYQHPGQ